MDVQLIYEGKDIAGAIEVNKVDITDTAGGMADSLEVRANDTQGVWSQWNPQKNDTIQVIQDGFDSGIMYVDEIEQQRGYYIIRALSLPQETKTNKTKCWEEVRFLEFAGEIAVRYGMQLQTYGIENYLYSRVEQTEQTDFEFLAFRCMLEGYALKITGGEVVIYKEQYMESQQPAKTIHLTDLDGDYQFKIKSTGIYSACTVTQGSIQVEYKAEGVYGPTFRVDNIGLSGPGEAARYAQNILRHYNKQERIGRCSIQLDLGIAAGNTIQIVGVGMADGKYFCEKIIHKVIEKKSLLRLRKPLEGY